MESLVVSLQTQQLCVCFLCHIHILGGLVSALSNLFSFRYPGHFLSLYHFGPPCKSPKLANLFLLLALSTSCSVHHLSNTQSNYLVV
ncbi:hypothetical protein BASA83_010848 [Batrachochytrium salamandrivorans]|nr:hypothetical protein BASA83_010848 [Batrachochytrium salamandrivorans]